MKTDPLRYSAFSFCVSWKEILPHGKNDIGLSKYFSLAMFTCTQICWLELMKTQLKNLYVNTSTDLIESDPNLIQIESGGVNVK